MTGIFDSGAGGLAALSELRRLLPKEDIIFLCDKENAPYGTKSDTDIAAIAEGNIKRLINAGASRVLIACCTASALYGRLSDYARSASVPIIAPAAKYATEVSKSGRIAVIATNLTVSLGAFDKAIRAYKNGARVTQIPAQALVEIAEKAAHGMPIESKESKYIENLADEILKTDTDTLVLGCTHFSHLKDGIKKLLGNVNIVDSAVLGARAVAAYSGGEGRTVLL